MTQSILTRVFYPYFQPYFKVVWTSQSGDAALTLLPWTGSWVSPQLSSPAPSCPLGEQCRQMGSTEPDEEAMSVIGHQQLTLLPGTKGLVELYPTYTM